MTDPKLIHPRTGLAAIGVINGRPVWPILGGSDPEPPADPPPPPAPAPPDPPAPPADSEAAVRGAKAEADKWRDIAKSNEGRAKVNAEKAKRLDEIEAQNASDLEKAVRAAREQERSNLTREFTRRIASAEVKAAAGGKLQDPADAVRLLDVDELITDGEVDTAAISKAIDELIKQKPYLAVKKAPPSFDGGPRESGRSSSTVEPGMGRMREAYEQLNRSRI